MTGSFSVKLKTKKGQFIVNDLNENITIAELKKRICQATEIKQPQLHVLVGFPPRPLDLNDEQRNLRSIGIQSGETLIVEEKVAPVVDHSAIMEDDEALARRLQAEEDAEHLRQVTTSNTELNALSTGAQSSNSRSENATVSAPTEAGPNGDFNGILLKKGDNIYGQADDVHNPYDAQAIFKLKKLKKLLLG
ncbi:uncharacterized protein Dmoj_GI14587 [Drosophila mojavensis]|uniref:Ubiquitin thioesterase OTU1 n=1 Tax=Drosophila mojavensis TaxID=7230 RepID=B4LAZ5_DROMO|nr:uncharacterized protein Dmoj_GI14587 [Drosophila mojavensis]